MTTLVCPAPAKLNLFLHVVGRRADGYHLLQTLFRMIDYGDTLHLMLREDGRIVRQQPLAGVAEENDLCMRAAQLLQAEIGCMLGVGIRLEKRLPMGAGLGGGSSDAASVLLGLNRLWGLGLSRARLQELALKLGADVPVFVFGQTAFAEGIGEALQAVALAPAWYVVLTPALSVSTAAIFAHPDLTRDSEIIRIADFSEASQFAMRNDLQAVVCRDYPEVARHLAWLSQHGEARMSGSGASVFAAFDTAAAAQRVLAQLPPDMRGFVAAGLDMHPLYDYAGDSEVAQSK
ncbi:4-diphosphocytidyl-2-C-methyl-D-erythritol kinase [Sulfuriferula plumbiphila]|uniref:4-diphosphocytidyl-2-C-methyl-D-erythritol kinase n=1 Tax=Sulfuriferula plumbiphila TaxID=171865 RepID=A0A512L5X2_9PROT|nr:4-(cytidine 5'-diphospho)-2-C-methyl-D-erythritol kinase [Sulfuriferula plumbiphila]BBP03274.1 4-diphosphocytidyl-2-C-methyl-D-erythritol kinase [Sulfuriferula plumbiphila]GEP29561.1 4-diphosphocytidyl-2-C-methyl-D-erythritol kinase [Sulfuriferula plumbiphila]